MNTVIHHSKKLLFQGTVVAFLDFHVKNIDTAWCRTLYTCVPFLILPLAFVSRHMKMSQSFLVFGTECHNMSLLPIAVYDTSRTPDFKNQKGNHVI